MAGAEERDERTDEAHRWTRAGGRNDAAGAVAAASAIDEVRKGRRSSRITRCREEELFLCVVSRRSPRAFPIELSDAVLDLRRRAVLV